MMQKPDADDRAVTGLELVVLVIVFIIIVYFSSVTFFGILWPGSNHGKGVLPGAISETSKLLRVAGPVAVFSATNGNPSDVNAVYLHPDPTQMGSIEADVALFIGDSGGIDFDRVNIVWVSNGVTETIPRKDTRPLVCPGWTIAGKYNVIPMKSANDNDILEPNEQFAIFVCPANTTPAYQRFNVNIGGTGGMQSPFWGGTAPVMSSPVSSLM
ncbi:MAG: hypothetical protein LUQ31_08725 [Methanoregula sp.]|nr:hypothetical protein [Methanoregula sp.]